MVNMISKELKTVEDINEFVNIVKLVVDKFNEDPPSINNELISGKVLELLKEYQEGNTYIVEVGAYDIEPDKQQYRIGIKDFPEERIKDCLIPMIEFYARCLIDNIGSLKPYPNLITMPLYSDINYFIDKMSPDGIIKVIHSKFGLVEFPYEAQMEPEMFVNCPTRDSNHLIFTDETVVYINAESKLGDICDELEDDFDNEKFINTIFSELGYHKENIEEYVKGHESFYPNEED